MKKLFFLLVFSLLALAVKCPQPDPAPKPTPPEVLPPATQTGANTFGCLINGKVWLPEGFPAFSNLNVQYYKGLFNISAVRFIGKSGDSVNQSLTWSYKLIYGPGTYYFKYSAAGPSGAGFSDENKQCVYVSNDKDSLNTSVTITRLDSVNNIVSGTFNLLFYPLGPGCDTLRITNGRFDAIYEY